MSTRLTRAVVPALILLVGCGAAFWSWQVAQRVNRLHQIGDQTFARIDRVQERLDEVADQELLYSSTGRADGRVLDTTLSLLQQVVDDCGLLAAESLSAPTSAARSIAEAGTTIKQVTEGAQENLRAGLDLTAADLAFTETQHARRTLRHQLRAFRTSEVAALGQARSEGLTQVWIGLAGVALLFAWVLIRGARTPAPQAQGSVSSSAAAHSSESDAVQPAVLPGPVDLQEVANICTAIGQLKSDTELPGLLERSVTALRASGLLIWIGAGEELFPASGVGYDLKQLNRMGPIPRSAPNATAAAWRTGLLQVLPGDQASRAAMVVPMFGSEGCVGVLAVELDPGREAVPWIQASAGIIAAQLAAVLAAGPAASSSPAAEVLPFERSVRA
jgi:hypothetical protein